MNTNETILKNNQEEPELFAELKGKPKTLAGYGIEDGAQRNTSRPVITDGLAMGDGRNPVTIEGDSTSGLITFIGSRHVTVNSELFTVSFTKPLKNTVYPVIFPASNNLSSILPYMYISNMSNTGFTLSIGDTNEIKENFVYKLTYIII